MDEVIKDIVKQITLQFRALIQSLSSGNDEEISRLQRENQGIAERIAKERNEEMLKRKQFEQDRKQRKLEEKKEIYLPIIRSAHSYLENATESCPNIRAFFLHGIEEAQKIVESQRIFRKADIKEDQDFWCVFFIKYQSICLLFYLLRNNYFKPLIRKRQQLIYLDDYGDRNTELWERELKSFVSKRQRDIDDFMIDILSSKFFKLAELYPDECWQYQKNSPETLEQHIDRITRLDAEDVSEEGCDLDSVTNPYEYEHAIAQTLTDVGIESRVTTGSGDQGADVVATHNDERFIIQCKLYSQPVGNKAVQEVSAAKLFYDGDYALVVTNNSFTKSAKILANKLNVTLLHHSQLLEFFGEGTNNSATVSSEENLPSEAMMDAIDSPDTQTLIAHASKFLDTFKPDASENLFVFEIGDCSSLVACLASEDEDVFRTYIDYLFKLTDGLSYDEKILFTFNDVGEDTLKYADDLDIRLFTDEKIIGYLQELIDIHIGEE